MILEIQSYRTLARIAINRKTKTIIKNMRISLSWNYCSMLDVGTKMRKIYRLIFVCLITERDRRMISTRNKEKTGILEKTIIECIRIYFLKRLFVLYHKGSCGIKYFEYTCRLLQENWYWKLMRMKMVQFSSRSSCKRKRIVIIE